MEYRNFVILFTFKINSERFDSVEPTLFLNKYFMLSSKRNQHSRLKNCKQHYSYCMHSESLNFVKNLILNLHYPFDL